MEDNQEPSKKITSLEQSYLDCLKKGEIKIESPSEYIENQVFVEDYEEDDLEFNNLQINPEEDDLEIVEEKKTVTKSKYHGYKLTIENVKLASQICKAIKTQMAFELNVTPANIYCFLQKPKNKEALDFYNQMREIYPGQCSKRPPDKKIMALLHKHRGNISAVAKDIKVNRKAVDKWIKNSLKLFNEYKDVLQADLDHTKTKLNELIDGVYSEGFDVNTNRPYVYKNKPELGAIKIKIKALDPDYSDKMKIDQTVRTEPITGMVIED